MLVLDSFDLNVYDDFMKAVYAPVIYVKDLNIKINNYRGILKITDLTNAMQPSKECNTVCFDFSRHNDFGDVVGLRGFSNFLDDFPIAEVIANWRNGFKYRDSEFFCYAVDVRYGSTESKNVFSPFLQPKKQKLTAGKNGRIRIATFVKAVLAGQIKEIICDGRYTDDYYYDHVTNYSKGKRMDLLDFAEHILNSPGGFSICPKHSDPNTLGIAFLCNDFYHAITQ